MRGATCRANDVDRRLSRVKVLHHRMRPRDCVSIPVTASPAFGAGDPNLHVAEARDGRGCEAGPLGPMDSNCGTRRLAYLRRLEDGPWCKALEPQPRSSHCPLGATGDRASLAALARHGAGNPIAPVQSFACGTEAVCRLRTGRAASESSASEHCGRSIAGKRRRMLTDSLSRCCCTYGRCAMARSNADRERSFDPLHRPVTALKPGSSSRSLLHRISQYPA